MTDLLMQFALSNLVLALPLAILAWAVQRSGRWPAVAHVLWLVVLVKLVTPPLVPLPLLPAMETASVVAAVAGDATYLDAAVRDTAAPASTAWSLPDLSTTLALLWLLGSAGVLGSSLVRVLRFDRLLRRTSETAAPEVQHVASWAAQRLGLTATPTIYTTSARLSPMVWWIGGRVRVVVAAALLTDMDSRQIRFVLAHELAHVKRRDHLVRWLEWLACVALWWNPVAWWARRSLRVNEEICCDALVLEVLRPDNPRTYANSLLTVVEFLSAPALRPPVLASAMISGDALERRFKMIVSRKPSSRTPRRLRVFALACALAVLPLGITRAEEEPAPLPAPRGDAVETSDWDAKVQRIEDAVKSGKLTREQADKKHAELRRRMAAGEARPQKPSREEMAKVKAEIWNGVEDGSITEVQAKERWKGYLAQFKDGDARGKRPSRDEMAKVKAEIWKHVESGAITEAQARERWDAYAKGVKGDRGDARRKKALTWEQYRAVESKLRNKVRDGKITHEAAEQRLAQMRKAMSEQADGADGADDHEEDELSDAEAYAAGIRRRLDHAVETGTMTRERADTKFEALMKAYREGRRTPR